MVIDQVLCVLGGGDGGAGGGRGRRVGVAMAVSVGVLSLVLEEAVTQDGNHHHNAGNQEHSNGHLHGAYVGNGAFPPKTKHILLRDPMTGLKTLLFLFKVVFVAITTAIGKAGTAFTEGVVIPAWDVLLAEARVWQVHTVPFVTGERKSWKLLEATGVFFTDGLIRGIRAVRSAIAFQEAVNAAAIATVELSGVTGARAHWIVPFYGRALYIVAG